MTVRPTTDFVETRFAAGATLTAGPRTLRVAGHRWQSGTLLVTFDQVTDRSSAEALRGAELWATLDGADLPVDEDEFHDHDLIGLTVRVGGIEAGRITGVQHLPGQDVLVIATPAGERLVPFVAALVPTIDVASGWVEVADLPGLLVDPDETAG